MPSSVKIIKERAFVRLKKLNKVTIPNTVTKLEMGSFDKTLKLLC
ncbi:MAG: leucine-rich repeat protein [Lachnospiraceae bacterium]|nr:leucine-rich repeat protein [Lachnospiraceae bacterium]